MPPVQLILAATLFAAERHRDQRRRDEFVSPYINHPIAVAALLNEVGKVEDPEILTAALLHDVLEDTPTQPEELEKRFGPRVAAWVGEVTDEPGLPRDERWRQQLEKAPRLSKPARMIKIADKISNVHDRARHSSTSMPLNEITAYLEFAEQMVRACAGTKPELEEKFFDELSRSRHHLSAVLSLVQPSSG